MTCSPCAIVRQYAYNLLLTADLTLNSTLAGDPHESVSQRTDRARAAGSKAAARFCKVLTFLGRVLTLDWTRGDHCTWAMSAQTEDADEIWHWTGSTSAAASSSAIPALVTSEPVTLVRTKV